MAFASARLQEKEVQPELMQYLFQLPIWIRCMSGCCY
jgi:hypothetical protein